MKLPSVSSSVSVGFATFVGGFVGYVTHLNGAQIPGTAHAWEQMLLVATLMGIASVVHLYQDNPNGKSPAVPPSDDSAS